jgi:hypothetical protein
MAVGNCITSVGTEKEEQRCLLCNARREYPDTGQQSVAFFGWNGLVLCQIDHLHSFGGLIGRSRLTLTFSIII